MKLNKCFQPTAIIIMCGLMISILNPIVAKASVYSEMNKKITSYFSQAVQTIKKLKVSKYLNLTGYLKNSKGAVSIQDDVNITGNVTTADGKTVDGVDVSKLSGFTDKSCATNQLLKWDGDSWECAVDVDTDTDTDTNTTYTAGNGLMLDGTVFSSTLGTSIESSEITDATILAADLASNDCGLNEILKYNGSAWACSTDAGGVSYSAGTGIGIAGGVISSSLGTAIDSSEITDQTITFNDISNTPALDNTTIITGAAGKVLYLGRTLTDATSEVGMGISVTASDTTSGSTGQNGLLIENMGSTEALDNVLLIKNNDNDDTVMNGIAFDPGGSGTDFTYGINFDLANIGTADIVLENGEMISNNTDGTVAISGNVAMPDNNGIILGTDTDATMSYDETTDDRVELSGTNAGLWVEDRFSLGTQALTITDDGNNNNDVLTPTASVVIVNVTGSSGPMPNLQISNVNAKIGDTLIIIHQTGSTFLIDNINYVASTDPQLGEGDSATFIYDGVYWLQTGYSNNTMPIVG